MGSLDLTQLMILYARQGIRDWRNAPDRLKRRAREHLGVNIAERDREAEQTIHNFNNGGKKGGLRFIPMPKHQTAGIERCFFLPVRKIVSGGRETAGFELFLLVTSDRCMAFRFEPADVRPSTHDYGHVQLCRTVLEKSLPIEAIPEWLPVSYPAFAISSSDPLQMFLCMTTAVHGYYGGVMKVLRDIFQNANRPNDANSYFKELADILR